jgi:hypothetical protein
MDSSRNSAQCCFGSYTPALPSVVKPFDQSMDRMGSQNTGPRPGHIPALFLVQRKPMGCPQLFLGSKFDTCWTIHLLENSVDSKKVR